MESVKFDIYTFDCIVIRISNLFGGDGSYRSCDLGSLSSWLHLLMKFIMIQRVFIRFLNLEIRSGGIEDAICK
jgi:hypothetical protein